MKTCPRCRKELAVENQAYCRACRAAYDREYRAAHAEEIKRRSTEYRRAHLKKFAEKQVEYIAKLKGAARTRYDEEQREALRRYREAHRLIINARERRRHWETRTKPKTITIGVRFELTVEATPIGMYRYRIKAVGLPVTWAGSPYHNRADAWDAGLRELAERRAGCLEPDPKQ